MGLCPPLSVKKRIAGHVVGLSLPPETSSQDGVLSLCPGLALSIFQLGTLGRVLGWGLG